MSPLVVPTGWQPPGIAVLVVGLLLSGLLLLACHLAAPVAWGNLTAATFGSAVLWYAVRGPCTPDAFAIGRSHLLLLLVPVLFWIVRLILGEPADGNMTPAAAEHFRLDAILSCVLAFATGGAAWHASTAIESHVAVPRFIPKPHEGGVLFALGFFVAASEFKERETWRMLRRLAELAPCIGLILLGVAWLRLRPAQSASRFGSAQRWAGVGAFLWAIGTLDDNIEALVYGGEATGKSRVVFGLDCVLVVAKLWVAVAVARFTHIQGRQPGSAATVPT